MAEPLPLPARQLQLLEVPTCAEVGQKGILDPTGRGICLCSFIQPACHDSAQRHSAGKSEELASICDEETNAGCALFAEQGWMP